jgi:uncharacterized membrane protein
MALRGSGVIIGPRGVSYAQLWLSILFIAGYFGVLYMLLSGRATVEKEHTNAAHALIGVLSATVVQIMGYWFARQRPGDTLASEVKPPPRRKWFKRRRK